MVTVNFVRLEGGYAGLTDGDTIWLDCRLNAEQLLCTLLHELIHVERGHAGHQREEVEMEVRYETARRLLPLDRLVGAHTEGATLAGVARELGVTRQVLMDRAATLSDAEATSVGCWSCLKCPAIAARAAKRRIAA